MRSSLAKFTQLGAKRLFKAELKAGSAKHMEAKVEARRAKRGVWQGDFVTSADRRHHQWSSQ